VVLNLKKLGKIQKLIKLAKRAHRFSRLYKHHIKHMVCLEGNLDWTQHTETIQNRGVRLFLGVGMAVGETFLPYNTALQSVNEEM
jgi:hypothetical protein